MTSTPSTPIPGVPQWADGLPTNTELAATIRAIDAVRAAHADVQQRLTAAKADPNYTSIPPFQPTAAPHGVDPDSPEWDQMIGEFLDYARSHYQSLTEGQQAAQQTVQDLGWTERDLNRMVLFTRDHQIIDGVAVRVEHHTGHFERIQIGSNATDVRRYVEAEKQDDGTWLVMLGDLDVTYRGPGDMPSVTAADADEVTRVGLEHVLAPLRPSTTEVSR